MTEEERRLRAVALRDSGMSITEIRQAMSRAALPVEEPTAAEPEEPDLRRCEVCGEEFTARRGDARLCSGRCRQRASRAARQER